MSEKQQRIDLSTLLFFQRCIQAEVSKDMADYEKIAKDRDYTEQKNDLSTQKEKMIQKYGSAMGLFLDKHLKVILKERLGLEIDNAQLKKLCADDYVSLTKYILENKVILDSFANHNIKHDEILSIATQLLKLSEKEVENEVIAYELGDQEEAYANLISNEEKAQYANMLGSAAEADLYNVVQVLQNDDTKKNIYYNLLIDEYINHLKISPYPSALKMQNLKIAYQAKAELLGEEIMVQLVAADHENLTIFRPSALALGEKRLPESSFAKRNTMFETKITEKKQELSSELNHAGLSIFAKLITQIRNSLSKKQSLIKVSLFSSQTYGAALAKLVDNNASSEEAKSPESEETSPKP